MATKRIEASAVVTVVGLGSAPEVDLLVLSNGNAEGHSLKHGQSFKIGYFIDAPEDMAEEIVVGISGSRMVDDSLETLVSAELTDILVQFGENPEFDFAHAVKRLTDLMS